MSYLLDTCVISEALTRQPNPKVLEFVDNLDPEEVYLSAITIGELFKGIARLPASRRKNDLQTWFEDELLVRYEGKILALDAQALMTWGRLMARLEADGSVMPALDSLIAAIAFTHDMTLVTRNVSDFEKSGVKIANPWE
ncbi:MAG: type II toxin-antitoxin system VapC family toxin [Chloroflexota bacterium]